MEVDETEFLEIAWSLANISTSPRYGLFDPGLVRIAQIGLNHCQKDS